MERLELSPKNPLVAGAGPNDSGVYALYWRGELVYVGKVSKNTTKSGRTLRDRLGEHRRKIAARHNIALTDMTCRYLTFASEWWVFAAEFALIVHYEPTWNGSGFGGKIPGKGRPGTDKVSLWNDQFPERPKA